MTNQSSHYNGDHNITWSTYISDTKSVLTALTTSSSSSGCSSCIGLISTWQSISQLVLKITDALLWVWLECAQFVFDSRQLMFSLVTHLLHHRPPTLINSITPAAQHMWQAYQMLQFWVSAAQCVRQHQQTNSSTEQFFLLQFCRLCWQSAKDLSTSEISQYELSVMYCDNFVKTDRWCLQLCNWNNETGTCHLLTSGELISQTPRLLLHLFLFIVLCFCFYH